MTYWVILWTLRATGVTDLIKMMSAKILPWVYVAGTYVLDSRYWSYFHVTLYSEPHHIGFGVANLALNWAFAGRPFVTKAKTALHQYGVYDCPEAYGVIWGVQKPNTSITNLYEYSSKFHYTQNTLINNRVFRENFECTPEGVSFLYHAAKHCYNTELNTYS